MERNATDWRIVGNTIERRITRYDVEGNPEEDWLPTPREIAKDMGQNPSILPRYDDYVVVPSHTSYNDIVGNCINKYHPIPHKPKEGVHPYTDKFLKHIFGEQYLLGWDYLTLLYRDPLHILPVLCLVSHQNGTGKSTFANFLSWVFGKNVGFFTQDDLNSSFNCWIVSLVAVFEEITDTKRSVNKIKAMSTAQSATLNEKYKAQISFRPFVKIVILSNDEETFITANEEDIRYWVVRVPALEKNDFCPDFNDRIKAEIPAVLYTLETREMSTQKASRMWFSPEDICTEALQVIRQESLSECAKDVMLWAEQYGNFRATLEEITQGVGRYPRNQIQDALRKELKMKSVNGPYKDRFNEPKRGRSYFFPNGEDLPTE